MSKQFEGNDDWTKREQGRIPTKGAAAADRASAGLGTSEDDSLLQGVLRPGLSVWEKQAAKQPRPQAKP
jgi:hypothetical protein